MPEIDAMQAEPERPVASVMDIYDALSAGGLVLARAGRRMANVSELVDELGGPHAAALFFNVSDAVITWWKKKNRIPCRLFAIHQSMLSARGILAPSTLWDFERARDAETEILPAG